MSDNKRYIYIYNPFQIQHVGNCLKKQINQIYHSLRIHGTGIFTKHESLLMFDGFSMWGIHVDPMGFQWSSKNPPGKGGTNNPRHLRDLRRRVGAGPFQGPF